MNTSKHWFAAIPIALFLGQGDTAPREQDAALVSFPEAYRSWQLVKSIVIGPESAFFSKRGGIHHYYANPAAVAGYQTGVFPEGAVIVDEAMLAKEGEGPAKGILLEDERRFLEVMQKYEGKYPETGGWRFQRFEGHDQVGQLTADDQINCSGCHENAKDHDHVFSRMRP
ncbi:MAG: cytochrome P460 family protein [Povalibacter sp.]